MTVLKRSGLVWSLLVCLVLVNGFMAAPGVGHAAQHESHQAGTHSTGFCAWLCAAGQGVEAASVEAVSIFQPVDRVTDAYLVEYHVFFSSPLFIRGPPHSSR